MKLVWSLRALARVEEIASFIAQDRTGAAEGWIEEIFGVVQRLQSFPRSGRVVPEVGRVSIREVIHGGFRIIYRVEHEHISVLTVRHSRQLTGPDDIPE